MYRGYIGIVEKNMETIIMGYIGVVCSVANDGFGKTLWSTAHSLLTVRAHEQELRFKCFAEA